MSSYNIYLFITKNRSINFGIIGLQTHDNLNIIMEAFINKKETKIIEAKLKAKLWITRETGISGDYNIYYMMIKDKSIMIV